ncbi:serine hydrolase domain-containing protein [Streptomyces sp. NPDC059467]|uniref:serine hydrolase domain-containing protein n=1 Tax=Streptomyces sp. NPDC059467 TaxID=3346844 RepID=UPI0036D0C94D
MSVRTTLVAATALALSAALAAPALAAPAAGHSAAGHSAAGHSAAGHSATRKAVEAAVAEGVTGVTATARDAHGTWSTTAGVGNTRTGDPRSPSDHYRVGSITKTFVATVLLQLEAEGRLSLDDTVDRWLPGVVTGNGNDGRRITVRQLLNHTSGIFNYTADDDFGRTYFLADGFLKHRYDTMTPAALVAIAMKHKPAFAPGTSWAYSNTNYVLAGMVIKAVTGRSYAEEITNRLIRPLHLTGTSLPGTRPAVPGPSSRAYSKLAETTTGPTYDVTTLNPSLASSAGEMISTSADLTRFYEALLRGSLLPPHQLKEMKTTTPVPGAPNSAYGLGLIDQTLSCGRHVWGHDGGIHGSTSTAATTADGRHALALNFNADWTGDPETVVEAEFCGG